MKKVLCIVVLTFFWCNFGIAKNITILFSSEKEVALLSKQTPLSDKVYYRANAAGVEHCKKYKKYAFRSSIGMRKSEIEKYYKSKGYKPLPMAEKVSKQCLSLPIYPELPNKHVKNICNILNKYNG